MSSNSIKPVKCHPDDSSQPMDDNSSASSISSLADYEDAIQCISMGISMNCLPASVSPIEPPTSSSNNSLKEPKHNSSSFFSSASSPSKSLSLSAKLQNILASKFTSRKTIKMFVDENTGRVLDNLYYLVRDHTKSKSTAKRMVNDLIKVNLKFILLHQGNIFNSQEREACRQFEDHVHDFCEIFVKLPRPPTPDSDSDESPFFLNHSLRLSRISGYIPRYMPPSQSELDNLCQMIEVMSDVALGALEPHTGKKTQQRLVKIKQFFTNREFFEELFSGKDMNFSKKVVELINDIQELMDRGII